MTEERYYELVDCADECKAKIIQTLGKYKVTQIQEEIEVVCEDINKYLKWILSD